jgi:tRNA(Arg) A34 adenosine deaminase TadA
VPAEPERQEAVKQHECMRLAIEKAREGIAAGQMPFGALVVCGEAVVAVAHNTVWRDRDPTAHAEVNAVRQAAVLFRRIDLSGCTMFATCEPCPMCLAAVHWSKMDAVYYGATIADAEAAGFSQLSVEARKLAELGGSRLVVAPGPLREECVELFAYWRSLGLSPPS